MYTVNCVVEHVSYCRAVNSVRFADFHFTWHNLISTVVRLPGVSKHL